MSLIRRIRFHFFKKKLQKEEVIRNLDERINKLEREIIDLQKALETKQQEINKEQKEELITQQKILHEWLYGAN